MPRLFFVTHPEVVVDPQAPVERWRLSESGVARMRAFAESAEVENVRSIWASTEAKAIEAAGMLAARFGIGVQVSRQLGENDRSATGFLPPAEFERVADRFFAEPEASVRGWERAVDAQHRIRAAVDEIVAGHREGDIAVIAHGGVGTLLLCSLARLPISREADQPFQGNYWAVTLPDKRLLHAWKPIAPRL